jgi:hypothetical protein
MSGLRRFARLARLAAYTLMGIAVLYLGGMNVFLGTHLFRNLISAEPESLRVEYDRAYSLWPGRIHVEGLSIRGRDSNIEWILRLDRCDFHVIFADLARMKFHVQEVRGDGLGLRVRLRADVVSPGTMAALPPVPGFPDPPLTDVGPPPPPITDATYRLWSVDLEDVVADHVREVWIDTLRYSGDLEIRGRWAFRPMRMLDVGPATIDVRALDAGRGTVESWASAVRGHLAVRVYPVDLQAVRGVHLIDSVSVSGGLRGTAELANAVNRATQDKAVTVTRATASFAALLNIDHGVMSRGTDLRIAPFDARASAAGLDFEGTLQGDLRVDDTGTGHADLHAAGVSASAGKHPRARAASVAMNLSSRQLDLTHAFADATFALDAAGAETDSLETWLSRMAPASGLNVTAGTVTGGGHLVGAVAGGPVHGRITFRARDLSLVGADLSGQGTVDGDVLLASLDRDRHTFAGVADLVAERMTARVGGATLESDVHAHAAVRDGHWSPLRLDLSGSHVELVDALATVKGVRFEIPGFIAHTADLAVVHDDLAGTVSVEAPRVELRALATVAALVPLPDDVVVDGGRATASLRLDVDVARLTCAGEAKIVARGLRMRMGAQSMPGELVVALRATERGDRTDLSGSSITFRGAGAPDTLDWWGRVHLRETTLRVRPRLLFRTFITAEAKDASPWTALVASSTPIPQWVLSLVSTAQFEVTGEVLATPSVLSARSVDADAKGAEVHFELEKTQTATSWAMLLDLGAVVGGVGVADGKTQVLLFGARPWFQERTAWLEAEGLRNE